MEDVKLTNEDMIARVVDIIETHLYLTRIAEKSLTS
jgi:hypothetical protein